MGAKVVKCPKCGYDNPPEGTQDGKCDECGHPLLPEGDNLSSQISDSISNSVVSTSTIKRVVNYIGDLMIARFIIVAVNMISSKVGSISFSVSESGGTWLFNILLLFLYYFLFEARFQRTPAKFVTRTKVVMKDGSKPSEGSIALRTLIRFVPFIIFSMSSYGTWWHDQWTDTRVVDSKKLSSQRRPKSLVTNDKPTETETSSRQPSVYSFPGRSLSEPKDEFKHPASSQPPVAQSPQPSSPYSSTRKVFPALAPQLRELATTIALSPLR
jgi:hypothetical protein